VLSYSIHNIYNYLTPGYIVIAVLIGIGASALMRSVRAVPGHVLPARPVLRTAAVGLMLMLLPAMLFTQHYAAVDRSDDHSASDFARTTLERLPAAAVVMTDSWTASPLWYAQLVEGQRRDVLVSPIFSVPGADATAFARQQMASGRRVYVADGLRTSVSALEPEFTVQPVLLNGIEMMLTDTLPKPEYRDDLVPFGSLYRVTEAAPDLHVSRVPSAAAREVTFDEVTLVGFETDVVAVRAGSVAELTYYWRADRALAAMPTAVTTFAAASGDVAERYGRPRWWQSRTIGQGVLDVAAWDRGQIVRESYFTLVPRHTSPGTYDVQLTVFDASSPHAGSAAAVTVGRFTVLAP
jgi:hypothetical protein